MKSVAWSLIALIAGLVTGFVLVQGIEFFNSKLYPLPAGFDLNDTGAISDWMKSLPMGAFLIILAAWVIGTFGGAYVAASLASVGKLAHALVIGMLLQLAGIAMITTIEHPKWFTMIGLASFMPVAMIAGFLAMRRSTRK